MNDLLRLAGKCEIQAAAGDGKLPQASIVAYKGGLMTVPGFGPLVIDLAGMILPASLPILVDHRNELSGIVGSGVARIDAGSRLLVEAVLADTPETARVVSLAKSGFEWSASIGAEPLETRFIRAGETVRANGRTIEAPAGGFAYVTKSRLREVSLTPAGSDTEATVSIAASQGARKMANENTNPDPMKAAWDQDGLTASERIMARWNAMTFTDPTVRSRAEKGLHAALGGTIDFTTFENALLKAQVNDLNLERIRAERPAAQAIHASTRDTSPEIIQAAFCKTAGLRNLEKAFKPEVLEASDRFGGFGLQELLLGCAAQNGYHDRAAIRSGNLRPVLQAAFSTHTITTLLTTAGNKFLLEGFAAVPQTWREVAAIRSVNDFKQVTAFRLTTSLEYEELPPTGEIHHGTMGQESYTMQAKTYARMLALTRTDIINDDLGAFDTLRTRLGMGAVLKMNKVFWTAWLAASNAGTFWTAARGNYQTGGTTALSEASLATAEELFLAATGPDGNLINLQPDRLLVPPVLGTVARKTYVSQEMRDPSAGDAFPVANINYNRFRPVIVPELSNAGYTGYSATAWWLACAPGILASAAMCFLNGVEAPTIESSDVDFEQLGIQLRGYHDFGVSMTEYRASVKSAGA